MSPLEMRSMYSAATLSGPITASSVPLKPSINSLKSPSYFEASARTSSFPSCADFARNLTSSTIEPMFSTIFFIADISIAVSSLLLVSRSTFILPREILSLACTALLIGLETFFEMTLAKNKPRTIPTNPTAIKMFREVPARFCPESTASSAILSSSCKR